MCGYPYRISTLNSDEIFTSMLPLLHVCIVYKVWLPCGYRRLVNIELAWLPCGYVWLPIVNPYKNVWLPNKFSTLNSYGIFFLNNTSLLLDVRISYKVWLPCGYRRLVNIELAWLPCGYVWLPIVNPNKNVWLPDKFSTLNSHSISCDGRYDMLIAEERAFAAVRLWITISVAEAYFAISLCDASG